MLCSGECCCPFLGEDAPDCAHAHLGQPRPGLLSADPSHTGSLSLLKERGPWPQATPPQVMCRRRETLLRCVEWSPAQVRSHSHSEEFHPWPPASPFPTEQQNSGGSTSVSSRPQFLLNTPHSLPSALPSQDLPGKPRAPQVLWLALGEDPLLGREILAPMTHYKAGGTEGQTALASEAFPVSFGSKHSSAHQDSVSRVSCLKSCSPSQWLLWQVPQNSEGVGPRALPGKHSTTKFHPQP
ncbi:uncharacterized protein LOC104856414 isoform X2 [Fukomys damarensis]|uniref:uncharacterized protein LOC104856414 isoform X2 n=1 Tax=Fukomys damarensis TaxID=885580 RepID=UPI001455BA9C|nr:uncharacterized protein LOC104856414 isoform X2 [Fukomys damarensis]